MKYEFIVDNIQSSFYSFQPFFQKLQVWTGIDNITVYNVWDVADTIFIEVKMEVVKQLSYSFVLISIFIIKLQHGLTTMFEGIYLISVTFHFIIFIWTMMPNEYEEVGQSQFHMHVTTEHIHVLQVHSYKTCG